MSDNQQYNDKLRQATDLILKENMASTSMLCRKMKINYNESAEIMDQLERLEIVGEFRGAKPRQILVDPLEANQILLNIEL